MSNHENSYESGSPPRSWHAEDARQLEQMAAGMDSPLFVSRPKRPIPDLDLRKLGQTDFTPRGIIIELMDKLGMINHARPDFVEHVYEKVTGAVTYYREAFWEEQDRTPVRNTEEVERLFENTEAFEDIPLLREARRLRTMLPAFDKLVETEHITRLLVYDEMSRLWHVEQPTYDLDLPKSA